MHMEEFKLDNYVVVPRYIKTDYFEGKISKPERNLLMWLRLMGSPYGIATITMDGLANDTFNNTVDKSYINKLLLSLKSKRYVWYSDRTGRRGSFEVHMGDWILPTKHIKRLERFFDAAEVIGETTTGPLVVSEDEPENEQMSQSFSEEKTIANKQDSIKSIQQLLRGYDNDKYKEKENEKDSLQSLHQKDERDFSISGFKETSYEELRCKEIATAVCDDSVAFNVGIYRKNGLPVLERAYREFENSKGTYKDNPPAFFNYLVQEQLDNSD